MSKLILVGGSGRSGKTRLAMRFAQSIGTVRVYMTTGQQTDPEIAPLLGGPDPFAPPFHRFDEPVHLTERLVSFNQSGVRPDVVVLDRLTVWISTLVHLGHNDIDVDVRVRSLIETWERSRFNLVIVSDEHGMGLVPESPIGRIYRDAVGRAHQRLALRADEVWMTGMGMAMRMKPGPVESFAIADVAGLAFEPPTHQRRYE